MPDLSETIKRLESDPQEGSQVLLGWLETFFEPLVQKLDKVLDKRLVRTLLQCLVAIIRMRNNAQALWLSELGSEVVGYEGYSQSAPAWTNRVGKLLRSVKWTVALLERYVLEKADEEVQRLKKHGKRILCWWDGSVVAQAASEKVEGLCPVLSSKAQRRQRTQRAVIFNWPAMRPVRVMGMQWSAGVIAGMGGVAQGAVRRWWTTRGDCATKLREAEEELLRITVRKWGHLLLHVFERGSASGNWLQVLRRYGVRLVIGWVKKHLVLTMAGEEKKLWQIGQGKSYLTHKEIQDPLTGEKMPCALWWTAIRHPSSQAVLYLVKARVKQGVMSLITNESVKNAEQAWMVFFAYRRRWQIAGYFRFNKYEFALQCPR